MAREAAVGLTFSCLAGGRAPCRPQTEAAQVITLKQPPIIGGAENRAIIMIRITPQNVSAPRRIPSCLRFGLCFASAAARFAPAATPSSPLQQRGRKQFDHLEVNFGGEKRAERMPPQASLHPRDHLRLATLRQQTQHAQGA